MQSFGEKLFRRVVLTDDEVLAAPCLWCDYNGQGYWQEGTHDVFCPWRSVGGIEHREAKLKRLAESIKS